MNDKNPVAVFIGGLIATAVMFAVCVLLLTVLGLSVGQACAGTALGLIAAGLIKNDK
ncbi:hypothetical protein [Kutzneria chonburiensis]|uniref:Uncharacterized protein n=1 Tax=Kutzneria chonburiensis TaxID=1483604 RepID=A0ABV6N4Z5_9PSEU|nr:hypothetical protein [Kutzneria chonburiensis]